MVEDKGHGEKIALMLGWAWLLLAAAGAGSRLRHQRRDVYLAGFFPTSPGMAESSVGQGVMPAVRLALAHVNQSPQILPRHKLHMHWNNTAVSLGKWAGVLHRLDRPVCAIPISKCVWYSKTAPRL